MPGLQLLQMSVAGQCFEELRENPAPKNIATQISTHLASPQDEEIA